VVALGISRGLGSLGLEPGLKWPNDVWLDGRKAAGVLLEMTAESDRVRWVVAGYGLNVRRSAVSPREAAYVSDLDPGLGVPAVTAAALDGVAGVYRSWLTAGFEPLVSEFERRSVLAGREVTVSDVDGTVRMRGTVEGVDAEGRLVLSTEHGAEAVSAGDVSLRG
jgi:BirA family biotin operon repressor/biotin-[acetyl-CoA-carboxylase] ligase